MVRNVVHCSSKINSLCNYCTCTLFATGLMVVVVAWLSPVWTNAPEKRPDAMLNHITIIRYTVMKAFKKGQTYKFHFQDTVLPWNLHCVNVFKKLSKWLSLTKSSVCGNGTWQHFRCFNISINIQESSRSTCTWRWEKDTFKDISRDQK